MFFDVQSAFFQLNDLQEACQKPFLNLMLYYDLCRSDIGSYITDFDTLT